MQRKDKQDDFCRDLMASWNRNKVNDRVLTDEEVEFWITRLDSGLRASSAKPPR